MIKQPFGSSELAAFAATAATALTTDRLDTQGMRGYRIWNLTPAFWGIMPRGQLGEPLLDIVYPWQYVQGSFEEALDYLELTTLLVPLQGMPTLGGTLLFGYAFTKAPLPARRDNLLIADADAAGTHQVTNVQVTNAATALGALKTRRTARIWNPAGNAQTVYIGDSNAVTGGPPAAGGAQGVPVAAGQAVTFSVGPGVTLFGILQNAGNEVIQVEEAG